MGQFLEAEKKRLIKLKASSPYFSEAARTDGSYRGHPYPFCLPVDLAAENLFSEIREPVKEYFAENEIKWHDGRGKNPSNHLCSSQVCCVNFLFPFANQPGALREILRPLYPKIEETLPVEDGHHVAMEWIGDENYLGERKTPLRKRSRGALFTSADAAVRFQRTDGLIQVVLIEWKYTESYGVSNKKISSSGTDRTEIYRHLYEKENFPLDDTLLPSFDSLFYEPFYQFLRQQLLANEMENAKELDADIVSLLHICPAHNTEFQKVTSPELRNIGDSVTGIWKKLQIRPDRFASVSTEGLFGRLQWVQSPQLSDWWTYLTVRYPWVEDSSMK